jgi:hypothetical protein
MKITFLGAASIVGVIVVALLIVRASQRPTEPPPTEGSAL